MKRVFGLMPSEEISIRKHFVDQFNLSITIEAGDKGYTIIYADGSTEYEDVEDYPENNFKKAYAIASGHLGKLKPITEKFSK